MSREPVILPDGFEIHFVQELYGNDDAILDIYELRKNFGKRSKTLKRIDVPQGSGIDVVREKFKASWANGGARHD